MPAFQPRFSIRVGFLHLLPHFKIDIYTYTFYLGPRRTLDLGCEKADAEVALWTKHFTKYNLQDQDYEAYEIYTASTMLSGR